MRKISLALMFLCGCAYIQDRGQDFLDMFKINGRVGYGLSCGAKATELVHAGVGVCRTIRAGIDWGRFTHSDVIEEQFPVSYISSIIFDHQKAYFHRERIIKADGEEIDHRCYLLLAHKLNQDKKPRTPIHFFDFEVGVTLLAIGFEAGFSLGEFFDFLVGFTTIDIADDDGLNKRRIRRIYKETQQK